jgi:major membrane immunogen (membrane-anchored lipoprotein)
MKNMKKRKSLKTVVLVTVLASSLLLAACGSSGEKESAPAATEEAETEETVEEAETEETVEEAAAEETAAENADTEVTAEEADAGEYQLSEEDAANVEYLKNVLDTAYQGVDENGNTYYIAFGTPNDKTVGVAVVMTQDTTQNVSISGEVTTDGDNFTITDPNTGEYQTFTCQLTDDNGAVLDMDGTTVVLGASTVDDVVNAIAVIANETEAVK